MKIIGITGGVGSGKSRILSFLETQYGAVICQADHVAWKLQEPGEESYRKIVECFGSDILNEDKTINRGKLGKIVFSDGEKLQVLNQITHPAVKAYIKEQIQLEKEQGTALFVIEAALLLEDHYDEICDELWYIFACEKARRLRLKESRNYSDDKIDAMMASQLSEAYFREHCQITIDNSGDFEDTCNQIKKVMGMQEKRHEIM